ncbi:hypothetical protein [Mucilaginibacter sp. 22184]|uniref:hypothetical protein n=1 Tax=Mucilaginibacter sp. 22184 TaxID=3453887 RepID=UPI003F85B765
MTENHSLSMYNYNTWANKTLLKHLKQLPEGTWIKHMKMTLSGQIKKAPFAS